MSSRLHKLLSVVTLLASLSVCTPRAYAQENHLQENHLNEQKLQSALYEDILKWYRVNEARTSQKSPMVHHVRIIGYQKYEDYLQLLGTFKANDETKKVYMVKYKSSEEWSGGFSTLAGTFPIQLAGGVGLHPNGEYRLWMGGGFINDKAITSVRVTAGGGQSIIVPVQNHRCFFYAMKIRHMGRRSSPGFRFEGLDHKNNVVY